MRSRDSLVGGILLVVSMVVAVSAWNLPEVGGAENMGPKAYPLVLSLILAGLSVVLMTAKQKGDGGKMTKEVLLRGFLPTVALLLLYLAVMSTVGFVICTIALLLALFWLQGERKWWLNMAAAVGSTLAIYLLFGKLLNVPLRLLPSF